MALDVGTVRIGVAVSDPLGMFAQGVAVLSAREDWITELASLIAEYDAGVILLGMPCRTDGSSGPEAKKMEKVAEDLKQRFPSLEIKVYDERFTTTIAERALLEADVSRRGRRKRIDKVAATLLLQSYLDSLRESGAAGGAYSAPSLPEADRKKGGGKRGRAYG